jgi:hypothetical protein
VIIRRDEITPGVINPPMSLDAENRRRKGGTATGKLASRKPQAASRD